ncbi:MAG: hydrolase, partial [Gemmatimonadetes bacterium]|nr:hydrolase [Gemmatimonadota bacterium]
METPDGDFLDLDSGTDPGPTTPIVLLLHGLEGSTDRAYMRVAMAEVARREMWGIGMNFRACSGEPNRLARFYHSGETGDLAFVLEHLRERHPGRPIGVIG